MLTQASQGRTYIGRLAQGSDLLAELNRLCDELWISHGEVRAIGAVSRAKVGYYDQVERVYGFIDLDRHLEILSLVGNVSLKDGKPFVHAHVVLGDEQAAAVGGHLAEGCTVFACEAVISELLPQHELSRGLDQGTGLPLWVEEEKP